MTDYLNESYGGSLTNMLTDAAYFCYTLRDTETGKYYSGARGVIDRNTHDLLIRYFTSSTVVDFKEKLRCSPELFEYRVEYFSTRKDAFDAETAFHIKHRVDKSPLFYNAAIAGGDISNVGLVICKTSKGQTYRVTMEEFAKGNHLHISKGLMNIRTAEGIKKIPVSEFDPAVHITEFKDYILALNLETGRRCRIPRSVYESDPKYVGVTRGIVVAHDTVTNTRVSITREEFENSNGRYVGNTYGLVTVIDKITGEKKHIRKEEYDKTKYTHPNSEKITVYSLLQRKNVKIPKDEYYANINSYANTATKFFFKVDSIFFKSKELLNKYYKETRGKSVLHFKAHEILSNFADIETITKDEHANGKD